MSGRITQQSKFFYPIFFYLIFGVLLGACAPKKKPAPVLPQVEVVDRPALVVEAPKKRKPKKLKKPIKVKKPKPKPPPVQPAPSKQAEITLGEVQVANPDEK